MGRVVISSLAYDDLWEIGDYIYRENPTASFRWVDKMHALFGRLAEFPSPGSNAKVCRRDCGVSLPGVMSYSISRSTMEFGWFASFTDRGI